MPDRAMGMARLDPEASEALRYLVASARELLDSAVAVAQAQERGDGAAAEAAGGRFMRKVDVLCGVAEITRDALHGGPAGPGVN